MEPIVKGYYKKLWLNQLKIPFMEEKYEEHKRHKR